MSPSATAQRSGYLSSVRRRGGGGYGDPSERKSFFRRRLSPPTEGSRFPVHRSRFRKPGAPLVSQVLLAKRLRWKLQCVILLVINVSLLI